MANVDMLPAYRREQQQIERHRRAIRLADGLLFALQINPYGQELTAWVSDTSRRDNRDALTAWVTDQLRDSPLEPGDSEILSLMERLTRHLNHIAEGVDHART